MTVYLSAKGGGLIAASHPVKCCWTCVPWTATIAWGMQRIGAHPGVSRRQAASAGAGRVRQRWRGAAAGGPWAAHNALSNGRSHGRGLISRALLHLIQGLLPLLCLHLKDRASSAAAESSMRGLAAAAAHLWLLCCCCTRLPDTPAAIAPVTGTAASRSFFVDFTPLGARCRSLKTPIWGVVK